MKPLTKQEIEQELKQLKGWTYSDDKLHKEFTFDNFRDALAFIVRVGFEAEEQVHHPELFNVYNTVTVSLSTHDAGGKVTQKDIQLATSINQVAS